MRERAEGHDCYGGWRPNLTSNSTRATPRASYLGRGVMDPDALSLHLAASRHPSTTTHVEGGFNAHAIRLAIRSMAACPRHPSSPAVTEGERQSADDPSHAKGRPWLGENEGKAYRGVFGAYRATGDGSRTLRDCERMTAGWDFARLRHSIDRRPKVGETSFDPVSPSI